MNKLTRWIRKWNPLVLSNRAIFGKGIGVVKRFWLLLLAAFVVFSALTGMFLFYYFSWALSFDLSQVEKMPETTIVYDRNGFILQRFYEQNRMFVASDKIPKVMKEAVIATEDKRFYQHFGFDPFSMTRAFFQNLAGARTVSGASTITQQLARNSADMFERTFDRKLKEIFLAMRLEMVYSKDQILTLYLNRIYFGKQNYGLAAATDAYFGKEPKDLTLSESAMLAGIISGPNSFSPWSNTTKSKAVRAKSLDRMVEAGYITEAEAKKAEEEPLVLRPLLNLPGSYAVAALRDELPSFLSHEDLVNGGLKIYTTVDVSFQRAAEEQLELTLAEIEAMPGYKHPTRRAYLASDPGEDDMPKYLQGSFVAINNKDGGILALVGGRKYEESTFNRATLGARQVGSTLKPFVYANAFNVLNISAFTQVDVSAFDLTKGEASGAIPTGPAPQFDTVRNALEVSNNYAAMRTGILGGVENFAYLVQQATTQEIPPFASSTLGACSITPLQMASAYSVFPNQGVRIQPYLVETIANKDGKVLYSHRDSRYRVLSPEIAFQVHSLLTGVVDNGTGRALRSRFELVGEVAGKTGTTNDFKDSWFMGYTPAVTAGVWIGLDEPQTILGGGYASRLAVPAWGRVMKLAESHYPAEPLAPPPGVQAVQQQAKQNFPFFGNPAPAGPVEYLRPDQVQNGYLARLDGSSLPGAGTALAGPPRPAGKEWWKFWESDPPANSQENPGNMDQDDDGNAPVSGPNKKLKAPRDRR